MVAIPGWKLFSGGGGPDTAVGGFNADIDGLIGGTTVGNMNQPFTAIIWFNPSSVASGSIIELLDVPGVSYNQLWLDTGNLQLWSNTGFSNVATGLTTNQWYFCAITHSGAAWAMKGWVAAVGAPTLSQNSLTAVASTAAYTHTKIGYGFFTNEYFSGALREYRLFNIEMTEAQLNAERASSTPVNTANLVNRAPLLTVATKLDATVGSALTEAGGGSWTDVTGPF